MLNMTRGMFGISLSPDDDKLCPFRAYVSWLCYSIGLHPILIYSTPFGATKTRSITPFQGLCVVAAPLHPATRDVSILRPFGANPAQP